MTIQPSSTCFFGVQFFHPLSDCDRLDWPFQLDFPLFCWLIATFNQWWFFTHKFDGWLWLTTTFFFQIAGCDGWMNLTPTNPPAFLSSALPLGSSLKEPERSGCYSKQYQFGLGHWAFLRSEVSDGLVSEVPNFPGFQWDQAWELPTSNGLSLVDQ